MTTPDERERHGAASASERVYGVLIRLYPEELRRRYGGEMLRYFGDLCREETRDRGLKGLAALWVRALPELVFTAITERNNMLARNAYLPVRPTTAARWGAVSALLGGALGTAYVLIGTMLPNEAWIGMGPVLGFFSFLIFSVAMLLSVLGLFGLYGALVVARPGRPGGLAGAGAVLAAVAFASWLALSGYEGAKALASGSPSALHSEWEIYLNWALGAVGTFGWVFGLLLLSLTSFKARTLPGRLRALPLVVAALLPAGFVVSALLLFIGFGLNGYGTDIPGLVVMRALGGTLPFFGSALLGWALLRSRATERLATGGGT